MSQIVEIISGPKEDYSGLFYNECMILNSDGVLGVDMVYYDTLCDALGDFDEIREGSIEIGESWMEGSGYDR